MNWIKNNKNGLLVGIVSTILCTIVFKLGNIIISMPTEKKYSFFKTWQNYLFRIAARQNSASFSEYFLFLLFGILSGCIFVFIIKSFKIVNETDTLARIKESNVLEKETDKLTDKELQLIKKYNNINSRSKDTSKQANKVIKICLWILVFMLVFLFIIITSCAYYPSQLWKHFELDLTHITPYTEESTIQMLKSDWVSMTKKEDYISIYDTIYEIKTENSLQ